MTGKKSELHAVEAAEQIPEEMLDADEAEFARLRRDIPGVKGASAVIGINVSEHTLYLTVTPRGAVRIIPINNATDNEYTRTKEIGLLDGVDRWVRLYTDQENKTYKVFEAPSGRFAEPIWPALSHAKIFRLAFRDKGRLIDSPEHALFLKWAARDRD